MTYLHRAFICFIVVGQTNFGSPTISIRSMHLSKAAVLQPFLRGFWLEDEGEEDLASETETVCPQTKKVIIVDSCKKRKIFEINMMIK